MTNKNFLKYKKQMQILEIYTATKGQTLFPLSKGSFKYFQFGEKKKKKAAMDWVFLVNCLRANQVCSFIAA